MIANKHLTIAALAFVLTQLVGCATNTETRTPAPVVETAPPVAKPEVKQPEKPVEPPPVPQAVPQTQAPAPSAASKAVGSLADQARTQYKAKNYQGAVATAERALKIDRRSPEVYLILAQSYVQLANKQLALQFVQQGIRYAQAGSELATSLLQMRDSLSK